jgi:hypothetical protein
MDQCVTKNMDQFPLIQTMHGSPGLLKIFFGILSLVARGSLCYTLAGTEGASEHANLAPLAISDSWG